MIRALARMAVLGGVAAFPTICWAVDIKSTISLQAQVPHGTGVEYAASPTPAFGVAIGVAGVVAPGVPLTLQSSDGPVKIAVLGIESKARWFPFKGAFFLGLTGGYQKASASGSPTISISSGDQDFSAATNVDFAIHCMYATPHIGWNFGGRGSFAFGFDLGVQFPFAVRSTMTNTLTDPTLAPLQTLVESSASYQRLKDNLESTGNQLGSKALPYVAIRMGWTF